MQTSLDLAVLWAQGDVIAHATLITLLGMSVISWYLIATKSLINWRLNRDAKRFMAHFLDAPDLAEVARHLQAHRSHDPFSRLTLHGLNAAEHHRHRTGQRLIDAVSGDEFLTRALRRAISQEAAHLEHGQTMLASIASTAPFVGLFGTVWGIYHALVNIGLSGSGSLDQVAGPVGEALIMTALGLAVAIPAVLAYNFFNRAKRAVLHELDGFAHDLFAFMSTGIQSHARPASEVDQDTGSH